jgi:hypothetical protein
MELSRPRTRRLDMVGRIGLAEEGCSVAARVIPPLALRSMDT